MEKVDTKCAMCTWTLRHHALYRHVGGSWHQMTMGNEKSPRVSRPCAPLIIRSNGGRTWWAHFDFTRINIELTFPKEEVEELMNVRGIGEASFLKLKALVTVTPPRTERAAAQ